ncbi:DNA polymerase III subunit beta [Kitasatospora sp. NPDC094016]|uniref:DNA polymerase III subunit beta n=1 Tax=Kitasatospora sp. NPDC094016 TaxID=3154986 RepID=UPI00331CCE3A
MKLRAYAGVLAEAVAHVARALPTRAPVPVLAGILLTTGPDGLSLAAYDYESVATCRLTAEIADDGTVLVPGRLLTEIAKALPKGAEVDIELSGTRLLVTSGSAKFTLPTLPVEEYPALPPVPDTVLTIGADAFADAVGQCAPAAGTDDSLPVLTGVLLTLEGETLTLAGTDRYRFAVREIGVQPTGTVPAEPKRTSKKKDKKEQDDAVLCTALVPAKWLTDASKALAGEHQLSVGWHDGQLTFTVPGGRTIGTRLLEGDFPRFRGLMPDPADAAMTLTIPVDEALAAIKRVALVVDDKRPIRLTHEDGQLLLDAGDGDDAHAADRIPCNASGDLAEGREGCDIAFKPAYLVTALQALTTPEARLYLTHPHKPALITGYSGGPAEDGYEHLLMPIRLNG